MSARARTATGAIDAPGGATYVLDGRVVTMNDAHRVIDRGRVDVRAGEIVTVCERLRGSAGIWSEARVGARLLRR